MKSKNKVLLSIFVKLKSYPSSFLYGTPKLCRYVKRSPQHSEYNGQYIGQGDKKFIWHYHASRGLHAYRNGFSNPKDKCAGYSAKWVPVS